MKAIVFDIDGVIITSDIRKKEIIKNILEKHNIYNTPGVIEILKLGLNRKLVFERISQITEINEKELLNEFNEQNAILESNPTKNENVINFIKNNYKKYIFSTNTSLPMTSLNRVIKEALGIEKFFKELLAYENGTKTENVAHILKKYNLKSKDLLFIDDNINHIKKVKQLGVKTLHFNDYNINIEQEILKLNN